MYTKFSLAFDQERDIRCKCPLCTHDFFLSHRLNTQKEVFWEERSTLAHGFRGISQSRWRRSSSISAHTQADKKREGRGQSKDTPTDQLPAKALPPINATILFINWMITALFRSGSSGYNHFCRQTPRNTQGCASLTFYVPLSPIELTTNTKQHTFYPVSKSLKSTPWPITDYMKTGICQSQLTPEMKSLFSNCQE